MHYLNPDISKAHVIIFYRNFLAFKPNYCHIGLGVNAMHTIKCLRTIPVRCDTYGVFTKQHIIDYMIKNLTCTHAVIEAPFISAAEMQDLLFRFPNTVFICRNHSQIGFLQVEPGAVQMLRDYMHLQDSNFNFHLAANSLRFSQYVESAYNSRCLVLPNLYFFDSPARKRLHGTFNHKLLRISSFGSMRLLKNHTTSAAAAQMIARSLNCDLEFNISTNREEQGGSVLNVIRNMFNGLQYAKLVEVPWAPWSQFRHIISNMDLCMQVSFTETFNITTADAIAGGVPAVISSTIEWLPRTWQADIDDATNIAEVGRRLINDPLVPDAGLKYLQRYVRKSLDVWSNYLSGGSTSNEEMEF